MVPTYFSVIVSEGGILTVVLVWEDELTNLFNDDENAYQMPTNSTTSKLTISTEMENIGVKS